MYKIKVLPKVIETKLKKFPNIIHTSIQSGTKYHCENVKTTLITGLRKNNLVKPKLSKLTMAIRKARGQEKPTSPLVGSGTMVNNLEVVKIFNGWELRPNGKFTISKPPAGKKGKTTKISIKRLWRIHEYGAIIPVTPKMRSAFKYWFGIKLKKNQLVIPERMPFRLAIKRYLKSQIKKETDNKVKEKIKKLLDGVR